MGEWAAAYRRRRTDAEIPPPPIPDNITRKTRRRLRVLVWSIMAVFCVASIAWFAYSATTIGILATAYFMMNPTLRDMRIARIEAQGVRRYKAEHAIAAEPVPLRWYRQLLRSVEVPHRADCWCVECKMCHEIRTIIVTRLPAHSQRRG